MIHWWRAFPLKRRRFFGPWLGTIAVGLATLGALMLLWYPRSTPYNNYALLADAFVHGHVWVQPPGDYIDALLYAGRKYIIEGPLPGVLLMPAAAFVGTQANQTLLSFILCAVAASAGWELARRAGVRWGSRLILTLFLLLGTDLVFCASLGDVWFARRIDIANTFIAQEPSQKWVGL